jgi:[NiFe] hydrogenase diaphorase moiety large subunit
MQNISLSRPQLLNALWAMHDVKGYLDDDDVHELSRLFDVSAIEVEGVVSFYHFFHRKPSGRHAIYLSDAIVSEFRGFREVRDAFQRETGARLGGVSPDGVFGLFDTSCIGLSDQEPAALIDFHPFTELTPQKVRGVVAKVRSGVPIAAVADEPEERIRYTPPGDRAFLLRPYEPGCAVRQLKHRSPEAVIREIRAAGLLGMGGAFFPTGLKWASCRGYPSNRKFVVCNADEGEPGTFKDRLLLHRFPGLLVEGMILGAYAVGASEGILYLRAEYRWLKDRLEEVLEDFRQRQWLGDHVPAQVPFSFDIRVQLGAGAYVCGEETALLNSLEGRRGEPRTRRYFPVERGYLRKPTIVNNVETFCHAARILELGAEAMRRLGTPQSPGTKLISVSGDCAKPGIYEIEWGLQVGELLSLCEAQDPWYVQVGGPSGTALSMHERGVRLCKEDLLCAGSFMIFDGSRDLLQVLANFSAFFNRESCGVCTPCRAGNFILTRKLEKLRLGLGTIRDLVEIQQWGSTIKQNSRCGLGQMAPNPILDAIQKFPDYFERRVDTSGSRLNRGFDLEASVRAYDEATGAKAIP